MAGQDDSVDFKTGAFGIKVAGPNAIIILLFIITLAGAALNFWENNNRRQEHVQTQCLIKLNLFVYTLPKGDFIDWSKMPVDLYPCIPKFLYERPVQ